MPHYRIYVTTEEPAMHCVDAKTGQGIWEAPSITQFAAASGKLAQRAQCGLGEYTHRFVGCLVTSQAP